MSLQNIKKTFSKKGLQGTLAAGALALPLSFGVAIHAGAEEASYSTSTPKTELTQEERDRIRSICSYPDNGYYCITEGYEMPMTVQEIIDQGLTDNGIVVYAGKNIHDTGLFASDLRRSGIPAVAIPGIDVDDDTVRIIANNTLLKAVLNQEHIIEPSTARFLGDYFQKLIDAGHIDVEKGFETLKLTTDKPDNFLVSNNL